MCAAGSMRKRQEEESKMAIMTRFGIPVKIIRVLKETRRGAKLLVKAHKDGAELVRYVWELRATNGEQEIENAIKKVKESL